MKKKDCETIVNNTLKRLSEPLFNQIKEIDRLSEIFSTNQNLRANRIKLKVSILSDLIDEMP